MTRVLFRVDASPRMGGGHVMRCLTLAQALLDEGCEVTFVSRASASPFATAFAWLQLPLALPDEDITPGWELVPWSSSVQRDDAIATRALAGDSYDWVVVDHYRLGAPWERELPGRKLVIDDLANRPHECNLLLDQNADRDPALYASLLPADCTILTGSRYALLRPEFSAARARALARRGGGIERILISLGAADTGNLTLPAVMLVGQICPRAAIDVVIGGTAERLAEVEALASGRVTVHVDTGRDGGPHVPSGPRPGRRGHKQLGALLFGVACDNSGYGGEPTRYCRASHCARRGDRRA